MKNKSWLWFIYLFLLMNIRKYIYIYITTLIEANIWWINIFLLIPLNVYCSSSDARYIREAVSWSTKRISRPRAKLGTELISSSLPIPSIFKRNNKVKVVSSRLRIEKLEHQTGLFRSRMKLKLTTKLRTRTTRKWYIRPRKLNQKGTQRGVDCRNGALTTRWRWPIQDWELRNFEHQTGLFRVQTKNEAEAHNKTKNKNN